MGEREQLVADIRWALDFPTHYVTDQGSELLWRALALLEPEEPARPEQCPECNPPGGEG